MEKINIMMLNNVVLLCPLDYKYIDIGWHYYPENGFIEDKNFINDDSLSNGFCGYLNGQIDRWYANLFDPQRMWAVLKTQRCQSFRHITIDINMFKCKHGLVVKRGSLQECQDFLKNYNT